MGKQRLSPSGKEALRRADHRGCDGSYRAARRNEARRMGYVWRALQRSRLTTGSVVVTLPM